MFSKRSPSNSLNLKKQQETSMDGRKTGRKIVQPGIISLPGTATQKDWVAFLLDLENKRPSQAWFSFVKIAESSYATNLSALHFQKVIALCKPKHDRLQRVIDIMNSLGTEKDMVLYSTLISQLAICENFEQITTLITEIEQDGLPIKAEIYNALLRLHAKKKETENCRYI